MPQAGRTTFTRIRLKGGTGSYILLPVLTTTQRDALTVAEGLLIFNSTTNQAEVCIDSTWRNVNYTALTAHTADLDAHTANLFEQVRTGEYMLPQFGDTWTGSMGITANYIYASPIFIARPMTFDRIATHVHAAAVAGSKARLGLYLPGTNFAGGALVVDGGEIAIDATGVVAATIDISVTTKGWYLVAIVSDVGSWNIRTGTPHWTPLGALSTNFTKINSVWTKVQTYGALPDPFPSGATLADSILLGIALRVASLD